MHAQPLFVLLLLIAGTCGCTALVPGMNTASLEPWEMVLKAKDLPEGYSVVLTRPMLDPAAFEKLGTVKKGYEATFSREKPSGSVRIGQAVLVMPADQLAGVAARYTSLGNQGTTFTPLPDPGIGDSSSAYRMVSNTKNEYYVIIFTKMDVAEILMTGGTGADYEQLKTVAKTAEAKIR